MAARWWSAVGPEGAHAGVRACAAWQACAEYAKMRDLEEMMLAARELLEEKAVHVQADEHAEARACTRA